MKLLRIGWRYLTGHAVATDVASRDAPEWPPHPARVFMAMAAAWFETDPGEGDSAAHVRWREEGDALQWLEQLGDPTLVLPIRDRVARRTSVTCFVPVNDRLEASSRAAPLQSAPSTTRVRQARTFPQVWVGDEPCYMEWEDVEADEVERHCAALQRLCEKVSRIGHSSSLVQMWVAAGGGESHGGAEVLRPEASATDAWVRPISPGFLQALESDFGGFERQRWLDLNEQIEALLARARTERGPGARDRRAELKSEADGLRRELQALEPHPPRRPVVGRWQTYSRRSGLADVRGPGRTDFDDDLCVLACVEGPRLPLSATLLATKALRDTLLRAVHAKVCGCEAWEHGRPADPGPCWEKIPDWVSGHAASGEPLRDRPHMALVALPFVGRPHADGHLVGLGIAFPRAVPRAERGRVLGPVLLNEGLPRLIRLKLGRIGVVGLRLRDWSDPRLALRAETWTALERGGATTWLSVTPVVLDRFPKADRQENPARWHAEVCGLVRQACTRVGLPEPNVVDVGTTSWVVGSPRAVQKRRPLRTARAGGGRTDAGFGDGFPPLHTPGSEACRPQVHVLCHFAEPVLGPVILGAGRYRGYGLLRPRGR